MKAFDETIDKNDEYYTPRYAVFPIVKYLKTNATVWCPFDLECSNFVQILKSRGFNVIHSHLCYFTDYNNKCNSVMTQPPFSSWYICHNVLPSQIVFEHLKRHKVDVTEDIQQEELFDL